MKKVFFKTFGCRTNIVDTQIMISNLKDFTLAKDENEADFVVINSCTVTNGADSNVRNYINRVLRLNSNAKIFFTGCATKTKGEELFKADKVYSLFGHSFKEKINSLLLEKERFFKIGDLNHIDSTIIQDFSNKSRAFVKIQEGCDFSCSYCIIPFVRGSSRSLNEDKIVKQVEILAENGFKEFVFTGINVGSYGKDTNTSIAKLLKRVSKIKGVKRVRLGSIEPSQIDDEFKEILDEEWLGRYLHIAIQHTSKEMLKIMNRRNRVLKDIELFNMLSDRGYALGTDFIVGHPKETETIWKEAIDNLKKFPLTHIHCFTYSKRDNTKSAQMLKDKNSIVKPEVAKERYNEVVNLIKKNNLKFRKRLKENKISLKILVETKKDGYYLGYDQFFNQAVIKSNIDLKGSCLKIDNFDIKDDRNSIVYKE